MRIESSRILVLPISESKAWRTLAAPSGLPAFLPELVDGWTGPNGTLRLQARVGRRRRTWRAQIAEAEPGRHLVLESGTPDVGFRFEATIEPHPEGSLVRTQLLLVPPARWLAGHPTALGQGRVLKRLLVPAILFVAAVAGLLLLPSAGLPQWLAALAYGLLGMIFLGAVALLSGSSSRRRRILDEDFGQA